jgi:hypothetical protein
VQLPDQNRSGKGFVMQTLKQGFEERNLTMTTIAEQLAQNWQSRLMAECPEQSNSSRDSIVSWLLGSDLERFDELSKNPRDLQIAKQAMEYRWRILQQRYLGKGQDGAYRNLMNRLGSLVTLRNKIQTWVALSRDRQRSVLDVLQEVVQELLQSDNYMQQQMASITTFTSDRRLQNALLFASVEEYCLRPIRNQPLLVYRFVNYLRRTQRGGLTQVPTSDLVKLVSEEVLTDDSDNRINLADNQAIADYVEEQELQEQQGLRSEVKEEFETYLKDNVGVDAVEWLQLYLEGKSQDAIAKKMGKAIKEIYRLREKVSYHAVRVFAIKNKPELVDTWLSISLEEHNLGLTTEQWQMLSDKLTSIPKQILELKKAGFDNEAIAAKLKLKAHQVIGEWTKIYLTAQELRSQE